LAKVPDRVEFQRMFQDASRQQFDVLLFWSLDRLSREGILPTLQHLQRLTSYGVGYRSFTQAVRSFPTHLFRSREDAALVVILLFIYLHNNVEMGGRSSL